MQFTDVHSKSCEVAQFRGVLPGRVPFSGAATNIMDRFRALAKITPGVSAMLLMLWSLPSHIASDDQCKLNNEG